MIIKSKRKRRLEKLYDERQHLAQSLIDTWPNPNQHTIGVYDGLNLAIRIMEGRL